MKLILQGHDERYTVEQSLLNLFPGELPEYGGLAKRLSGLITEGVPQTAESCEGLLKGVEVICR